MLVSFSLDQGEESEQVSREDKQEKIYEQSLLVLNFLQKNPWSNRLSMNDFNHKPIV